MKEVKTPRKPLLYYYIVALLVLLLFNFFAMPLLARQQVEEVDYGTFMTMTENKEIGKVEVEDNQIIFTNKDGSKIYKTGPMNDPDLTQRLYDAGAEFTRDIVEQTAAEMGLPISYVSQNEESIGGVLHKNGASDCSGAPLHQVFSCLYTCIHSLTAH